jgi:tRNA A-37 threonylcarbamoyl transferase component Bud32
VILTNYIEGQRVRFKGQHEKDKQKKWEHVYRTDYRLCEKTLDTLNSYGIEHGDARTSNFVMIHENDKPMKAIILDFGFSKYNDEYRVAEDLKDDPCSSTQSSMNS